MFLSIIAQRLVIPNSQRASCFLLYLLHEFWGTCEAHILKARSTHSYLKMQKKKKNNWRKSSKTKVYDNLYALHVLCLTWNRSKIKQLHFIKVWINYRKKIFPTTWITHVDKAHIINPRRNLLRTSTQSYWTRVLLWRNT